MQVRPMSQMWEQIHHSSWTHFLRPGWCPLSLQHQIWSLKLLPSWRHYHRPSCHPLSPWIHPLPAHLAQCHQKCQPLGCLRLLRLWLRMMMVHSWRHRHGPSLSSLFVGWWYRDFWVFPCIERKSRCFGVFHPSIRGTGCDSTRLEGNTMRAMRPYCSRGLHLVQDCSRQSHHLPWSSPALPWCHCTSLGPLRWLISRVISLLPNLPLNRSPRSMKSRAADLSSRAIESICWVTKSTPSKQHQHTRTG